MNAVHAIRGRANAWAIGAAQTRFDALYGARKARLLADLPDTVVELGAGTGGNLRYLRPGTHLVAIEPNVHMHPRLARAAARRGIELELHAAFAERLPLPDASVETVFATLVLCSVADRAAALAEVRRVLRPGGRFLCLEHVAAEPGTATARVQRLLRRPWGWLFDGCDPQADTVARLGAAGFASLALERFTLPRLAGPFAPHVQAIAVR